jgi:plasmid stabilization system protein ParE
MSREVIVRRAAERDVREAHSWYGEVSPKLADQFTSAVDQAIAAAAENPLAFQLFYRPLRRVLLRRFPYALFFVAEESRIVVVGVLHQSRNPRVAQRRR